ncbi:conserved hypothetical protein [Talaromyces stipitatus ATCC 10500]|uniref:Xylanolytic transcriptional activator regulatory domain-containing protein n=1 Tax=Talaromyces stipitatus (strain ATCC 10500 / CBS 375.48 / QM 6759 / NRRL 1006) TaxID=441959 RepID=B8MGP1_TALSN|nr:uncharacterized protein TSTA_018590 [Talaromyces stipitatus ATCC 10500]EED16792.1 conserved hypothetical protein [Talaromyces stipitatus ATCC 10500]
MGKLSLTDHDAVYIGSSHWVTILEEIRSIKDDLSDEQSIGPISRESTPFDAGFTRGAPPSRISLLASTTSFSREQILARMPPRKAVDRLVGQYFNTVDLSPVVLHRDTFLAEYANFWRDPSIVPIMWIGLLFSVMSMSAYLQQQDNEALGATSVESNDMLETYRALTIYCLVAGDYLRPSRYTIETLTLHFALEQNVSVDTYVGNWILMGVVIRIAFRTGLHRDPSHWPNIRPLQAELRRRTWMALYQMDFFTSIQLGLPRIIKDTQCDTRPPLSLMDSDIGLESVDYPPERPSTERTPLSHLIHRHAIIKVTAEIYEATETASPSSATRSILSAKIEKAVDSIPTWLRHKPLESSIAENPITLLSRINLDILIHKAVYLLHRWSFIKGSTGEESTKSNELCINAGLAILDHQRRINEELQPGGLMFAIRWRVAHVLNHEVLQATMILCFALSRFNESITTNPYAVYRRNDILDALKVSKGIWKEIADRSVEAQRAATTISSVLNNEPESSKFPGLVPSDGLFEQIPAISGQDYMSGFEFGNDMALDPSFLQIYDDVTFAGMLDEFVTEQS